MNPFSLDNLWLFMETNYILPTKLTQTCSYQFPTYYHQIHSIVSLCPVSVSKTKTHQFLSVSLSHTHTPPQTHKKPFSLQNLGCLSSGHEMDKYWLLIKIRWWGLHGEANSTRRHHKDNNPNVFLVIKLDTQHGKKWLKVSICIPLSQYLRSTSSPVSHLPTLVPIKRA